MNKEDSLLKGLFYTLTQNGRVLKLLGVCIGLFLIYHFMFKLGHVLALGFALIPISMLIVFIFLRYYHRIFYLLFASHFIFLIVNSFVSIRLGIITLIINICVVILLVMITYFRKTKWKDSNNGMLWLYLIWGVYCLLELLNPNNVQEAWNLAITYYFVYPVMCAILVPLTIRKISHIEWLLILWSVFILYGAFRGYWQKSHGFSSKELFFLFQEGGASTHIIWSGIRFFSFFTDAANYGAHMAMAILVFSISLFSMKNIYLKIYFVIVILAAIYGMGISGTRSAIAIPLGGLLFYVFLSRNWKGFLASIFVLISLFLFFRFTTIGDGNEYIRKMRSAFTPNKDASYNVRVINRERMKEYMKDKPFGYGLGLGGKPQRFKPKELMPIPPDSWLVNVWTDTGIIGLCLYLLLYVILFAWCSWILMFKIMNKRIRNLATAWLCMNAGFFIAAYANDVMQYPNMIVVYTGFALCFAAPVIEKKLLEKESTVTVSDKNG